MATHSQMGERRRGLPSLRFLSAVIVICGAITARPEEKEHFSETSRCPSLMRDVLVLAVSARRRGPPSLEWEMEPHAVCQWKPERGGGVYFGLEGIASRKEEHQKLRNEMKVKLRVCWFTNWGLKITLQLSERRPGTIAKPEWQCVGGLSTKDIPTPKQGLFLPSEQTGF